MFSVRLKAIVSEALAVSALVVGGLSLSLLLPFVFAFIGIVAWFLLVYHSPPSQLKAQATFHAQRQIIEEIVHEMKTSPSIGDVYAAGSGRPLPLLSQMERRRRVEELLRAAGLLKVAVVPQGVKLSFDASHHRGVDWYMSFVMIDNVTALPPPVNVTAPQEVDVLRARLCLPSAPKSLGHLCRHPVIVSDIDIYIEMVEDADDAEAWQPIIGPWYLHYEAY